MIQCIKQQGIPTIVSVPREYNLVLDLCMEMAQHHGLDNLVIYLLIIYINRNSMYNRLIVV